MANNISNHFAITALQDGVTVQGSLRIDGTLSQNYNPNINKCVPDWKADESTRPVVYAVIRRGVAYMNDKQIVGGKWLYNDVEITFGDDNKSKNALDADGNPLFLVGTKTVSLGSSSYSVPCLTIISNLASPTNVDLDTIGFQGSIEVTGQQAAFAAQVDVKIAQMTTQGFLGLLSPESAIITEKNQDVTFTASLYAEDGSTSSSFYTKWYFNNDTTDQAALRGKKSITVNETEVTDNLIVRCEFYSDSAYTNRVAVAFASVDDTQDPEYLYISLNGSNSDYSGQLSPGDSCEVTMWVATMEDSSAINTAYTSFTVRYYDGMQNEITTSLPVITVANNKGKLTIPYNFVAENGYKINGMVTAS